MLSVVTNDCCLIPGFSNKFKIADCTYTNKKNLQEDEEANGRYGDFKMDFIYAVENAETMSSISYDSNLKSSISQESNFDFLNENLSSTLEYNSFDEVDDENYFSVVKDIASFILQDQFKEDRDEKSEMGSENKQSVLYSPFDEEEIEAIRNSELTLLQRTMSRNTEKSDAAAVIEEGVDINQNEDEHKGQAKRARLLRSSIQTNFKYLSSLRYKVRSKNILKGKTVANKKDIDCGSVPINRHQYSKPNGGVSRSNYM